MRDAASFYHGLKDLLMERGLHIGNWISNIRDFMSLVPVLDRAKEVKDLDLDNGILPIDRSLGIRWCVKSDVFCFKIEIERQRLTKKTFYLWSVASSIH